MRTEAGPEEDFVNHGEGALGAVDWFEQCQELTNR